MLFQKLGVAVAASDVTAAEDETGAGTAAGAGVGAGSGATAPAAVCTTTSRSGARLASLVEVSHRVTSLC